MTTADEIKALSEAAAAADAASVAAAQEAERAQKALDDAIQAYQPPPVVEPPVEPPPVETPWWHFTFPSKRPGGRRAGCSYFGSGPDFDTNVRRYEQTVGLSDFFNGQHKLDDDPCQATMEMLTGGRYDQIDDNIKPGSYMDFSLRSNWNSIWMRAQGYALVCWSCNSISYDQRTDTGSPARIWNEIIAGKWDMAYENWGRRWKRVLTTAALNPMNHPANKIFIRWNHENNQSNFNRVFPATKLLYKAAMERAIACIKKGLGPVFGGEDPRLSMHFMHAPAHTTEGESLGDYLSWCPANCDVLSVSYHPGKKETTPELVMKYMMDLDNPLHYTLEKVLAAAVQTGKPICLPECSPRNDASAQNQIAHVVQEKFDWWLRKNATWVVADGQFEVMSIMKGAFKGSDAQGRVNWDRGVDEYLTRWAGVKRA